MSLTDTIIRSSKPKAKPYKLFDANGLFLLITPNGGKWWRFKFRYGGKEKLLSLGTYPETSLKEARNRRDQERKNIASDIDPAMTRKMAKLIKSVKHENTFEVVAREWFERRSGIWAETHSSKIIRRLELDIFPWLGSRPIADIKAPELLLVIRRIEDRGAVDTAHRALQNCGQIMRYAVATGRAERDCCSDLRGALTPVRGGHFAAITDPKAIGGLLRAIEAYNGNHVTRCALRLAPLVFVRPGELRKAQWTEIDFENAQWNIPADRMKMREAHLVPLSTQAINILEELKPLTSRSVYLFPSAISSQRPMSDNAILGALRRMGISKDEMSGHGFRAMARTVLDEVLHVRPDYIEHQLAHAVRAPNGRAYNRTAHLPERRKMMQQWADYLDELRTK